MDTGLPGQQFRGCGPRGCRRYEEDFRKSGTLHGAQGDTGVFYSTHSSTVVVASGPSVRFHPAFHTKWDLEQADAFGDVLERSLSGNGGRGSTLLLRTLSSGFAWRGVGSPVAGPDTHYTNHFCMIINASLREQCDHVGPWERIASLRPCVASADPPSPGAGDDEVVFDEDDSGSCTILENTPRTSYPLPESTTAIRVAMGQGLERRLVVHLRVVDANALRLSASDPDAVCAFAFAAGERAPDNVWVGMEAVVAHCVKLVATAPVHVEVTPPKCFGQVCLCFVFVFVSIRSFSVARLGCGGQH